MIVNKNEIENWKKDIIVIKLNNTQMYDTHTQSWLWWLLLWCPITDDHTHTQIELNQNQAILVME